MVIGLTGFGDRLQPGTGDRLHRNAQPDFLHSRKPAVSNLTCVSSYRRFCLRDIHESKSWLAVVAARSGIWTPPLERAMVFYNFIFVFVELLHVPV